MKDHTTMARFFAEFLTWYLERPLKTSTIAEAARRTHLVAPMIAALVRGRIKDPGWAIERAIIEGLGPEIDEYVATAGKRYETLVDLSRARARADDLLKQLDDEEQNLPPPKPSRDAGNNGGGPHPIRRVGTPRDQFEAPRRQWRGQGA
jgi:hypothetical protein